jgi:hypothetical protein
LRTALAIHVNVVVDQLLGQVSDTR